MNRKLFAFLVRKRNDKREVFGPEFSASGETVLYENRITIVRCRIADGYPVPEVDVIVPGNRQRVKLFYREKYPVAYYVFDPEEFLKDFTAHYAEFSRDFNELKRLMKFTENGNTEAAENLIRKLEKTVKFINAVFFETGYFALYEMKKEGMKNLVNYVVETHKRIAEEIDIYEKLLRGVRLW